MLEVLSFNGLAVPVSLVFVLYFSTIISTVCGAVLMMLASRLNSEHLLELAKEVLKKLPWGS